MSKIKDIERLVHDYETRIEELKSLTKHLNKMETKGFEKEVSDINRLLNDPRSVEEIKEKIDRLEEAINTKKKTMDEQMKQRPIKHFPYELTPFYKNTGLIGSGGFARVYRANRNSDDKAVAVKIPISMDRAIGKSFMKEMSTWTKLKHRNIVELYDHNILPIPYFEMELCESCLETISKPVEIEKAARFIFDTAEGLKYAHSKRIAHRDIKPQNILLKDGIPKITDWGLSKLTLESKRSTIEAFSPMYAAPEQISKKFGEKDEQTDIWQLGVMLYELVTGKLPFDGNTGGEIIYKIVNEEYIPVTNINEDAEAAEEIISKCLQKDKSKRYKKIGKLQDDIAKILNKEYKTSLKKNQNSENLSKSLFYSGELLRVNMKIGETKDASKIATELLKYVQKNTKSELSEIKKELEQLMENNEDIDQKLISKTDSLLDKIHNLSTSTDN